MITPKTVVLETDHQGIHNKVLAWYLSVGYEIEKSSERRRYLFFGDIMYRAILKLKRVEH